MKTTTFPTIKTTKRREILNTSQYISIISIHNVCVHSRPASCVEIFYMGYLNCVFKRYESYLLSCYEFIVDTQVKKADTILKVHHR